MASGWRGSPPPVRDRNAALNARLSCGPPPGRVAFDAKTAEERVSGRSVRFCTLRGAFLTSVEVPIERRAVDTQLLRHLTY